MKKIVFYSLIAILVSATVQSYAQKMVSPIPPIFGISAGTLPKGGVVYRSYVVFPQFSKMYNSATYQMVNMPSGMNMRVISYPQMFRYGLLNNLTFIANISYIRKRLETPNLTKRAAGFGDVQLALKTNLFVKPKTRTIFSMVGVIMLPTGKYKNLAANELPLGDGVTSYSIVGILNQGWGRLSSRFLLSFNYRQRKENGVQPGPQFKGIYTGVIPLTKRWIIEGDFWVEYAFKSRKGGIAIPHSETYIYQVAPGIQYRCPWVRGLLIQSAVSFVISSKAAFGKSIEPWFGFFYKI